MLERAFTFLSCFGCLHFVPKSPGAAGEMGGPALVGFCWWDQRVQRVQWVSLECAAGGERCPDREPAVSERPHCENFDCSTDSATRPYPESCLRYGQSICRLGAPNGNHSAA